MQPFNMLLLTAMALVNSLTSAAANVGYWIPVTLVTHTHPTAAPGGTVESWWTGHNTAWAEWTSKHGHTFSISMTAMNTSEYGSPTTSTIHTTETETVTALSAREEAGVDQFCTAVYFKGGGFCLPARTSKTKRDVDVMTRSHHTLPLTHSLIHSYYRSNEPATASMIPVHTAITARDEAEVEASCNPVFFKGGGYCLPTNTKRDDNGMTHPHQILSHTHSHG